MPQPLHKTFRRPVPPPAPPPVEVIPPLVVETQWKILGGIQEQIRFLDGKAAALLTADSILLGLLVGKVAENAAFLRTQPVLLLALAVSASAFLASAVYCVMCISPTLGFARPAATVFVHTYTEVRDTNVSLLFFKHITGRFGGDSAAYARETQTAFSSPDTAYAEVSHQVVTNARIATDKSKQVAWAVQLLVWAAGVALLDGIVGFFLFPAK